MMDTVGERLRGLLGGSGVLEEFQDGPGNPGKKIVLLGHIPGVLEGGAINDAYIPSCFCKVTSILQPPQLGTPLILSSIRSLLLQVPLSNQMRYGNR
jgi:hypothetical protein